MSRIPMGSDSGAMHADPAIAYKTYFVPQGIGADLIATKHGFSRTDVDAYAVESQRRAAHAWEQGYFKRSVIEIKDHIGLPLLAKDEHMRPGTTMSDLAGLKAAFEIPGQQAGFDAVALQKYPEVEAIRHVHTGGNSSGIVDGAAAVLLGTRDMGGALGLKARARIVGFASIGTDPTIMLTGPAPSAEKVLKRCGMSVADIDLFELNEAFAAQALCNIKALEIDENKFNICGGGMALGHPIGASGARVLTTLVHQLHRTGGKRGVVALCLGGGNAVAMVVEAC
jgi:acetyl-CoA C-acetyltransferase